MNKQLTEMINEIREKLEEIPESILSSDHSKVIVKGTELIGMRLL